MLNAAQKLEAEIGEEKPNGKKRETNGDSVFDLANGVDTVRVLDLLGIENEETPRGILATCPGCSEPGALVCRDGGLRCMHDRCKHVGPQSYPGFRTNVDLIAERRTLEPIDAAKWICESFGIPIPKSKSNGKTAEPPPDDDYEHTDADAPDAPPDDAERNNNGNNQDCPVAITVADVLEQWRAEGPLQHEPTGIAGLDELTGGGPCYGTRWYLAGAPDSGKTALEVQIAHTYLQRGIAVGLLASDEEATDIVTRLAQRIGYTRARCEGRDSGLLDGVERELGELPLRMYSGETTIESAARDLADYAAVHGRRAMLGIDSVQTVRCDEEVLAGAAGREPSTAEAVQMRTRAIRAVATRHRLIVLATSELGRSAYASRDESQRTATLAAGKWSGAIEYSARVLIGLRSVAGESDLVELELAKNKHGRTDEKLYLRLDRRSQMLSETAYEPEPDAAEDRRAERDRERAIADGERIMEIITAEPGIATRDLYAAAKAAAGLGRYRVDAALRTLGDRVERQPGPNRTQLHYPAGVDSE